MYYYFFLIMNTFSQAIFCRHSFVENLWPYIPNSPVINAEMLLRSFSEDKGDEDTMPMSPLPIFLEPEYPGPDGDVESKLR